MAHRSLLTPILIGLLAAAFVGWSQLTGFAWSDYDAEAASPLAALLSGQVATFFETAPAYGGSLLMRAPFAFATDVFGGDEQAVYVMMAVPCLLASVGLGVALLSLRRRAHPQARWGLLVVLLAAGNPVTLRALAIGHPEELIGAVCAAGAVLTASRDRPAATAVLLGIALANKAWAVVVVPVVFVAMHRHALRTVIWAGAIAAPFVLPFVLAGLGAPTGGIVAGAGQTGTIFQPWQVWWWLGDLDHVVRGLDGLVKPDYRYPPAWLGPLTHPLIAVIGIPLALIYRRRRGVGAAGDPLLLLALVLLLRCVLDPWNTSYYHLPFLFALLAWEAIAFSRPPVVSVVAVVLVWTTFEVVPAYAPPDVQAAFYLSWAMPTVAWLFGTALGLRLPVRSRVRPDATGAAAAA